MNLIKGFQLDSPNIFIPWGINEYFLLSLFNNRGLKRVTDGYYTALCSSLNGLNCQIGFHFAPQENGKLNCLEFFRTEYSDLENSYKEFQLHFEKQFGLPTISREGTEGYTEYLWIFENIAINHAVTEREGLIEYMQILCK